MPERRYFLARINGARMRAPVDNATMVDIVARSDFRQLYPAADAASE